MPRRKAQPAPAPVILTPEQEAERAAKAAARERAIALAEQFAADLRDMASKLAPAFGGRLVRSGDEFEVSAMFGPETGARGLCLAGPGLVEARVAVRWHRIADHGQPCAVTRFAAYGASGATTPEDAEALGEAIAAAARFARALLAACGATLDVARSEYIRAEKATAAASEETAAAEAAAAPEGAAG